MKCILIYSILRDAGDWLTIQASYFDRLEEILHCDRTQGPSTLAIMDRVDVGGVLEMKMGQFITSYQHGRFLAIVRCRGLKNIEVCISLDIVDSTVLTVTLTSSL